MKVQLPRYEGWSLFGLLCLLILVMTALILALNPDLVEGAAQRYPRHGAYVMCSVSALHVSGMWVLASVFTYSNFKRIPLSAWYALPFGIMFSTIAIRLVGKLAQKNRRKQPRAYA